MPVIKAQDRVRDLEPGDVLVVTCSDPGALYDIPAWCRINGHKILDAQRVDNEIIVTLEVGHGIE